MPDRPGRDRSRLGGTRLWAAATVIGLALLLVGWLAAAHEAAVEDQIVWANVAVIGLVVAAIGHAIWLRRTRALVRERARALAARLTA